MPFGRDYHHRIAERPARESARPAKGNAGRNLVHAADHNARVILEALRRQSVLTRQELAALTGLTAPGITNIIKRQIAAGLIHEVTRIAAGARAAGFTIEPAGALAMGVDIDAEMVSAVVIDLAGHVLVREQAKAASTAGSDVIEAVRAVMASARAALTAGQSERLLGVGVAGAAEPERLAEALAPLPVICERDTACSVIGERIYGAPPPDGSFVQILFGESVRAGLMIRGTLYDGTSHRAGLVGLMRTGQDGKLLDEAASLAGIAPLIARHEASGVDPDRFMEMLDAPGRKTVEAWIDQTASHLLDAIVAISGFIAPTVIFIGGRIPRDLVEELVDRLMASRAQRMLGPLMPRWLPPIMPATLGRDSVIIGASALPFLEYLLPDPRRPADHRVIVDEPADA
ncbi:ROK family transcriptional regulator [Kaistia dalseonensis]|uniref:NBD/HSP70 family sugar kinase n=1 Tax=Kaistia dalseonensis TaxID=410840 RepID=A0ABU0HC62_9HYPH|nr:ROK family transcriptional regulator [Kaistia dalseonensis]MCX5496734.1 ROK family transcriptional regulator [Kaistia dalseonensis]MDQ0439360.1 putative NBD/HSP70 family sugar kinase [Kaistia dalseonensis]